MTEKQGAAEWLRGIVDEAYMNEAYPSCVGFARTFFGIECRKKSTCTSCILSMFTAIADRIDAELALPEGIEWPRFEDGELVRRGDEVEWDGDVMRVGAFWFHREGWSLNVFCPGIDGTFHGKYGERVKRPDSWERIEEDAKLAPRAYLEARGMNSEKTERVASMMADLVRRAKALAKAGE